tara:strand:+ start:1955 stop:3229 length:1275 start_codon:yes stop_codon:yes gene_type:complete
MELTIKKIDITRQNSNILKTFLDSLDREKQTFRYFNKRGLDVINNHVCTCLLLNNNEPIAYGHLDKESGKIWLGIVIKKEFQGKGISKKMMTLLLNKASTLNLKDIQLAVDTDNKKAIVLYKKFGFELVSKTAKYYILKKYITKIGVSTLAFKGKSKEQIVEIAKNNNWIIEFSSSFPYDKEMIDFFSATNIKRLAHNYFPAPKIPFVLNLGSVNEQIRKQSIAHCIQGLYLSKQSGAEYFSAHAGFCIDPNPEQLGEQLDVNIPISRAENWNLFITSIKEVLVEAEKLNVSFLIENNVTAKFNLRNDEQEVLFCSRPEEMIKLIKEINSNKFGLLLDTAHLKVSSKTLHFDLESAVNTIKSFVKYIHHSDNNGEKDTNEPVDASYWFLPLLKNFKNCIHILEVKNIGVSEIENQLNLLNEYTK